MSSVNKVLVAMSGGVDSSVAAALLCEQGYKVMGTSMRLTSCNRPGASSCCSAQDRLDAKEVCTRLGIEHRVVDYRPIFRERVIEPFVQEYLSGRTPSPCILCNQRIKFLALLGDADRLGAGRVATGHYARIVDDGSRLRLLAGRDETKDQSYFLLGLTQQELARLLFPLGSMTKDEVRAFAAAKGLPTSEKDESQEVCFVRDGKYVSFVEECASQRLPGPGNFVDVRGRVLGRHGGIHAFTIGQRRGFGFGMGRRRYVVRVDARRNEVVLGSNDDLMQREMTVRDITWVHPSLSDSPNATVKIRSTHAGAQAKLEPTDDGSVRVIFDEPIRAIAPGQAAVFYRGDEVLGGGWIA